MDIAYKNDMDLKHLRCFVAVADELHFGHAALRLEMLPAALGRNIRLLEQELRTALILRTTRHVSLTEAGLALLEDARELVALADASAARIRALGRERSNSLRLGAIDSASAGLIPPLLHDFHERHPDTSIELIEDKTIRLLPQILSGWIDLAIVRPPEGLYPGIELKLLLHETTMVALPAQHPLALLDVLGVSDLANEPLIVPARRSRPHSYDLTMKLFAEAGLRPRIAQQADEKQTIVSLVAAGSGSAIVPRWTSRMTVKGVVYRPLDVVSGPAIRRLPLAAAWLQGSRDKVRDQLLTVLEENLPRYALEA